MPEHQRYFKAGGGDPNYGQPWRSYTPYILAAKTPFILGNGTLIGRFQLPTVDTCFVAIELVMGSTTNKGVGDWKMTLPKQAAQYLQQILAGQLLDAGTDRRLVNGLIFLQATDMWMVPEAGNVVGAAAPIAWAVGDQLVFTGLYEIVPVPTTVYDPAAPIANPPEWGGKNGDPALCYVNGGDISANLLLPSGVQTGDLAIAFAGTGAAVKPTAPAGWTDIPNAGVATAGGSIATAYRIIQAGDTDCGAWVNASNIAVSLYRGFNTTNPIGGANTTNGVGTTYSDAFSLPGIGLVNQDGSSLVVGLGWSTGGGTNANFPGMTNRVTGDLVCFGHATVSSTHYIGDTNGGVTNWGLAIDTQGGFPAYCGVAIEILAA